MNMKPRTLLVLIGIFLAGAVSGALLALRLGPPGHKPPAERRPFAERTMARLDEVLVLSPEQRPQVEAILRNTGDELSKMRRESWRLGAEAISKMNTQIAPLITPEQQPKFAAFLAEQEERMRRNQAERDKRGRLGREGQPPPPPQN